MAPDFTIAMPTDDRLKQYRMSSMYSISEAPTAELASCCRRLFYVNVILQELVVDTVFV